MRKIGRSFARNGLRLPFPGGRDPAIGQGPPPFQTFQVFNRLSCSIRLDVDGVLAPVVRELAALNRRVQGIGML